MNPMGDINIVTLVMACLFILPIVYGIVRSFSGNRVRSLFLSLFNNIALLVSIIVAISLTSLIADKAGSGILQSVYAVAQNISVLISGRTAWASIILIAFITAAVDIILHLLLFPLYRRFIVPLSERISSAVNSMNGFVRRIVGGVWQLPKSIWLVLVFSLFLSGYTSLNRDSFIAQHAQESGPYQCIEQDVIQPLLRSSVVRDIQVLFNNTFSPTGDSASESATDLPLIKYFNGVTLSEAITSNAEIQATALGVTSSATSDADKAYAIYQWICSNVRYDYDKAVQLSEDTASVSSGAIEAYTARRGVCFDFSCLYVAMCRDVGLRVRFITGLGYSGSYWGDHAWNQVYDSDRNAWINVDTTFGSIGPNYFGNAAFDEDHKNGVVQGEW